MQALSRFNAMPAVSRRLARGVLRAAFHARPSPSQRSHQHLPDGLRQATTPVEGNTNRSETLSNLDVLGSIPAPPSAVEATYIDGFLLNNGIRVHDGVILLNNEVFQWRPALKGGPEESKAKTRGMLELVEEAWGLLDVVYPKPELLILGTGAKTLMVSPKIRTRISELGIRLDVMSTHSAAAQYNLLATERGGSQIAAAMLVGGFGK
ncbi:hypothetical protein Q9L58_006317 [Maublancomyces gigas]|uniref:NADH dehydrogenase [ubiquinone] 1 alpha subcomplex assembly factor 3 n=1 Tax=Discina gigas TaxID=1032678 RepID=A0ABR3GGQ3_9PEZI